MWRRDLRTEEQPAQDEPAGLPDWWRLSDYVALFVALFQSIAIPFLALAFFFLLIAIALVVFAS
ncbi:MAG: hypothetical protein MAG451_01029 [Anaerolineales bacterium]|nr:hypothetical protein [Anaerolineales bacterium]